jgi:hypothetical protein
MYHMERVFVQLARGIIAAAFFMVVCSIASPALATTMYTYTGSTFTSVHDENPPAGSYAGNSISISFTLADPLGSNLGNVNIAANVLSFSMSDGLYTLDQTSFENMKFEEIDTDGSGNIVGWFIQVSGWVIGDSTDGVYDGMLSSDRLSLDYAHAEQWPGPIIHYDEASTSTLGTWSRSDSAVPLPAALPLFASGLGVMGVLGWRRKRKKTAAAA